MIDMYREMTDEKIVLESRKATDSKTWESLMNELARRVQPYLRWLGPLQDEVSSEVWLEFYTHEQGRPRFDPDRGSLKTYIQMRARAKLSEFHDKSSRLAKREVPLTKRAADDDDTEAPVADPRDPDVAPEDVYLAAEDNRILLEAIRNDVTPRGWQVARKMLVDLKKIKVVAEELGVAPATVKRDWYKAAGVLMGAAVRLYFPDGLTFLTGPEEDVFLLRVEGVEPSLIAAQLGLDLAESQALLKSAVAKIGDRI